MSKFGLFGDRESAAAIPVKVLERILNEMHSSLYVSDMENDIILYANERLLRSCGVEALPSRVRCWELLHKRSERCDWCPVYRLTLEPSALIEWEEYNENTGRYYRNTDCLIGWNEGQKVHLHHRVDVTDIKKGAEELKKRLEQQELMVAIARSFITTAESRTLILDALRMSGEFLDVGEMLIARLDKEAGMLAAEYVWHHPAKVGERAEYTPDPERRPFGPGTMEYDAYIENKLPCLSFEDISDVAALAHRRKRGVKAFIGVPVYVFGSFWGELAINECRRTRAWNFSDIHLVELIGTTISGVLERSITEQRLARMSAIVNGAPQFICYLNKDAQFQYFNPGALRQLGYADWELLGKDASLLFAEKQGSRFKEGIWPMLRERGALLFEAPLRTKRGEERIMSVSAFVTDFSSLGVGIIASDITDKRQLEKDLLNAKEEAIRANVAKSDFLSRMSHEIRTPLNAIIGMTGIARSSDDERRREYCLEKIDDASNHLLGVINDVLDISKIESGKLELADTEFTVEDLLRRVINVVHFRMEEKEQTLVLLLAPEVPASLVTDEQRLAQVLANLLSNAVKFTPDGGVITMDLRLLAEEDSVCTLRLEVKDTGIGLNEEQKARLFHSFAQADASIARRFGGTGLGLAISRLIVEMMGGAIWVESETGAGASFIFTVRCLRGSAQEPDFARHAEYFSEKRFLVLEGASDAWVFFAKLGECLSVGFDCALTREAALDMLGDGDYAAAFLDWKTLGEEGPADFCAAAPALPLAVMSSAVVGSDIEIRAREAGASSFVPKPLFASAVIESMYECLGRVDQLQTKQPGRGFQPTPGCFAGRRVLLAEDIEVNREIVVALLEETGLIIDCAADGKQACEMYAKDHAAYDLIFMDLHMPELDGFEAARRIRSMGLPRARMVPIIAMTASVFREDIDKCLASGMDDHIGKPMPVEELFSKLRRYLP